MFMDGFIERLLIWIHGNQRRPVLPCLLKNKGKRVVQVHSELLQFLGSTGTGCQQPSFPFLFGESMEEYVGEGETSVV